MPSRGLRVLMALRAETYFRYVDSIAQAIERAGGEVVILSPGMGERALSATRPCLSTESIPVAQDRRTPRRNQRRQLRAYFEWVRLAVLDWDVTGRFLTHLPLSLYRPLMLLHRLRLTRPIAAVLAPLLAALERRTPPDAAVVQRVRDLGPDLVLVTPAIYPNTGELEYLKAALALGIPSVVLVASWDNLTSKGIFHVTPQRILVWNEIQVSEVVNYYGLPRTTVRAVGAPVFDKMFTGAYAEPRALFCARAGLDAQRPYVLWAASSSAAGADEPSVVRRLLGEMRRAGAADPQVLIRPHPKFTEAWSGWREPGTVLWGASRFPESDAATRDLYSSIDHAAAVTGLSTSLFLEGAILDKPCALVARPDASPDAMFARFHHFQYLLDGGFLERCHNETALAHWLAHTLAGGDARRCQRRAFVQSFLRPAGVDRDAGQVAFEALKELIHATSGAPVVH